MNQVYSNKSANISEYSHQAMVKKILIVDSNPFLAKEVEKAVLEIDHISLGIVSNIHELEKRIRHNPPDMMIINIETKGDLNGYQIAKVMKIDCEEIPFCILYPANSSDQKAWAEELNPDGFVSYQGNINCIKDQLNKILA